MDITYKDIHIIDRNGNEVLTCRMCTEIAISDNIIAYKQGKDKIVHELCLIGLIDNRNRGLKVVID